MNNVVSIHPPLEMKTEKITVKGAQLITLKLSREAEVTGETMSSEQRLWLSVIFQHIRDLSWVIERYRQEALSFFNGNLGDFEIVCEFAGLNHENVLRAIRKVYQLPEYRTLIDPNADFIERAKRRRAEEKLAKAKQAS